MSEKRTEKKSGSRTNAANEADQPCDPIYASLL